jgi:hypothetical protein
VTRILVQNDLESLIIVTREFDLEELVQRVEGVSLPECAGILKKSHSIVPVSWLLSESLAERTKA